MFYALGGLIFIAFIFLSEKLISRFVNFILYGTFSGDSSQNKS